MRAGALLAGGIAGAALMFMFDPRAGRRRRALTRDRLTGVRNRSVRRARRFGRRTGAEIYGVRQKMTHMHPEQKPPPNDVTLARTVESELFRDPHIPKGRINISAESGVVVLRGEMDRDAQISVIEQMVRKIPGVYDVENLMHVRGTPAPNKIAALQASGATLNRQLPRQPAIP
jgi:hypothetical protein